MLFTGSFLILAGLSQFASSLPVPASKVKRGSEQNARTYARWAGDNDGLTGKRAAPSIDPSLVPEFGVQAGVNPDGTGNCDGINGIKIPCDCPPDRQLFINDLAQNVAAGHAINNTGVDGLTFPTGDDIDSQLTRFHVATVSLQNLRGPGVGCPQVSTTWSAQVAAIQAGKSAASAVNDGVPVPKGSSTPSKSVSSTPSKSGSPTPSKSGSSASSKAISSTSSKSGSCAHSKSASKGRSKPGSKGSSKSSSKGGSKAGSKGSSASTTAASASGSSSPGAGDAQVAAVTSSSSGSSSSGSSNVGGIDPSLVPEFGVQAGVNPDGTGNCEGVNGSKIPCSCPPDRQTFINDLAQNVAAGHAINNTDVSGLTFPTGDDIDSQLTRFHTATVSLQNLHGPGVGCPQVSTTWSAQVAAIQAGKSAASAVNDGVPVPKGSSSSSSGASSVSISSANTPASTTASSASAPAATSSSASSASNNGIDPSLVPEFGVKAGVNPDGTGNCEGVNGSKIPCSCPPDRQTFINDLAQNVAAGHAINNTDVSGLTFPTGDDIDSQLARFHTATVSLQNLHGPGVGCPQVSTTWSAQVAAIQAGKSAASAVNDGVPQAS